jgi:hypothetical protein
MLSGSKEICDANMLYCVETGIWRKLYVTFNVDRNKNEYISTSNKIDMLKKLEVTERILEEL